MVHYDDQTGVPIQDYRIPYDPWSDPGYGTPIAPSSNEMRQAIRAVIDAHRNWSPPQIKVHLERTHGYADVPVAAIYGVKAGM